MAVALCPHSCLPIGLWQAQCTAESSWAVRAAVDEFLPRKLPDLPPGRDVGSLNVSDCGLSGWAGSALLNRAPPVGTVSLKGNELGPPGLLGGADSCNPIAA